MSKRTMGFVINMVGIAILFVALAADALGLGAVSGMGWKQWTGAGVGVVVAIFGMWLTWRDAK